MTKGNNGGSTRAVFVTVDDKDKSRSVTSEELFRGEGVITILHNKERYSLRITRQNKLILTK